MLRQACLRRVSIARRRRALQERCRACSLAAAGAAVLQMCCSASVLHQACVSRKHFVGDALTPICIWSGLSYVQPAGRDGRLASGTVTH